MALIGNCSNTTYTEHPTETVTSTITNPDGTTSEVTYPATVETTTDYTNIYLCIKQIDHYKFYETDSDNNVTKFDAFHYRYAAYTNKATRDADQEDFLFSNVRTLENHNHDNNLYTQIYNEIKTLDGLTNLTDD